MKSIREVERSGMSGGLMLLVGMGGLIGAAGIVIDGARSNAPEEIGAAVGVFIVATIVLAGLVMVNPNEAVVLQLFGEYVGTLKESGLRWVNPLYGKRRVSV